MIIERLKSGVITVGHGRGFVVEGAGERLVITAAHCLPSLPPALPSFGLEARTYGPLLARRGEEPRAWALCRFVDPIADIAGLASPANLLAGLLRGTFEVPRRALFSRLNGCLILKPAFLVLIPEQVGKTRSNTNVR